MQYTDEATAGKLAREMAYRVGYSEPRKACPKCLRPVSVVCISTAKGFEVCFRFYIFCSSFCEPHTGDTVDLVSKAVFSLTTSQIIGADTHVLSEELSSAVLTELGKRK